MTVPASIDPARLLEEQLAQASPDLLRELLQTFLNTLLSAEADSVCGAGYGERTPERVNQRNGYRHRDFDTRASSPTGHRSSASSAPSSPNSTTNGPRAAATSDSTFSPAAEPTPTTPQQSTTRRCPT